MSRIAIKYASIHYWLFLIAFTSYFWANVTMWRFYWIAFLVSSQKDEWGKRGARVQRLL